VLARLSDPTARTRLTPGCARYLELSPPESLTLALASVGTTLGIVVALSPKSEDDTFRFLARLVLHGVLVVE
jgi:hypothetical protein